MSIEHKCSLIRQYILEKKGVDIGAIAPPRNEREWDLFDHAWMTAAMHFAR